MEELTNIISCMLDNQKTVILSSTVSANNFSSRLKSRIVSGMVAPIYKPNESLKLDIAKQRIAIKNIPISDDCANYLVKNINEGIRGLIGAINRISTFYSINKLNITIELIKNVVGDMLDERDDLERHSLNFTSNDFVSNVISATSVAFNIHDKNTILSENQTRLIVEARGFAMYIVRQRMNLTFKQLADLFKRKTHNTVMIGVKKIEKLIIKNDLPTKKKIEEIKNLLR